MATVSLKTFLRNVGAKKLSIRTYSDYKYISIEVTDGYIGIAFTKDTGTLSREQLINDANRLVVSSSVDNQGFSRHYLRYDEGEVISLEDLGL